MFGALNMLLSDAILKHGSERAAARALNIPYTTFRNRLQKERSQPAPVLHNPLNVRLVQDDDRPMLVCVIGDFHRAPGDSNQVPVWIGKYLTDMQPDAVIHIGDLGDFDSVTRWIEKGSQKSKTQSSIDEDIEAVAMGFRDMHAHYHPDNTPVLHVTLGNHDHRLWIYEDLNPQTWGTYTAKFTTMLEHYGWSHSPYGQYYTLYGVNFVHAPKHEGGGAISGKTAGQRIAAESTRCIVSGHTHKLSVHTATKLGQNQRIMAVNVGCAMPWGKVKDYAKLSACGWWWGVVMLTIHKGRVEGILAKPMFELEKEYG